MDLAVDPARLLFGVGALLGIVALLYFGFEAIAALSPTVKALALLLGFVAFLAAAQAVDGTMETLAYVLGAGSYIVFLLYTVWTFDVGTDGVFLLLAVSSALFVALGYVLGVRELSLDERQARLAVAAVVVVLALLVVVDIVGAQPTVSRSYEDSVAVPAFDGELRPRSVEDGVRIGTLTVTNGFALARHAELPRTRVCVAPLDRSVTVRYGDEAGPGGRLLLGGGGIRTYAMRVGPEAFLNRSSRGLDAVFANVSEVPVVRGDRCPTEREEPALVVIEDPVRSGSGRER